MSYPLKVTAPGVSYRDWYRTQNWEEREGTPVTHLVMHDTEGSLSATLGWFANPESQVSAHDVIDADGTVYRIVTYDRAAWHAGGATSKLNPGANRKSVGIELVYPAAPASPPWPQAQLNAAVAHAREIVRAFGIARANVLRHAEIDPTRRSDPRNFPWTWFLDRLYGEVDMATVQETIRNEAWAQGGINYNPNAAFPRYAREHNLGQPTGPETDTVIGGRTYRWQRFTLAIVYCEVGQWDRISTIPY